MTEYHSPNATIGLAMIVKNEAHVIERCLRSVRPVLSHWTIVDTGSTDSTEEVVRGALAGIPGEFVHRPWVDFATNRNQSLELARSKSDYTLIVDADDRIDVLRPLPALHHDAYRLPVDHCGMRHLRNHLIANRIPWRYVGRVHEVLESPVPVRYGVLDALSYVVVGGGARSSTAKFLRDIEVLEQVVREHPEDSRSWYYLAQSHRDAGHGEVALELYRKRARMTPGTEESFWSLVEAALLTVRLERSETEVVAAFTEAWIARPTRAEPLYYLGRYFRKKQRFAQSYLYACTAAALELPADRLLVDVDVYRWRALDLRASTAFHLAFYRDALACNEQLLQRELPAKQRERAEANRKICLEKINAVRS